MTVVIQNVANFGGSTNSAVSTLFALNGVITRLSAAVASASSGYTGEPGTEFEGPTSLFGVVPNDTPGAQGQAFASAVVTLTQNWNTFWSAAQGALDTLDNGTRVISPI